MTGDAALVGDIVTGTNAGMASCPRSVPEIPVDGIVELEFTDGGPDTVELFPIFA